MEATDGAGTAPYILQPLMVGLDLEGGKRSLAPTAEPKARRQSLSRRLGFQSTGSDRPAGDADDTASQASDSHAEADDAAPRAGSPLQPQSASPAGSGRPRAVRIECAEISGSDVYVGTNNGQVMHYTLETAEIESGRAPDHLRVQTVDLKLGGKRVEHMLAFPALGRLVVLCGSTVVFYSLPDLRPVGGSMPTIKGVSCIGYDERVQRATATSAVLCVARMREVGVYRMGAELRLEQQVEIAHSVASICMYGNYVCLADSETYKILDLARLRQARGGGQLALLPTQQPRTDGETGRVVRPPRPRTLVVGPDEFMFLTSSGDDATLGVIVTALGEALRGTLQFATYPRAVVYDEPHVVALSAGGQIDVFDTRVATLVQTLPGAADAQRARRLCLAAGTSIATRVSRPEAIDVAGAPDAEAAFSPQALHRHAAGSLGTTPWTEAVAPAVGWRREPLGASEPPGGRPRAALSRWAGARIVVQAHDSLAVLAPPPQLVRVDALIRSQRVEEAMLAVEAALGGGAPGAEARYCLQMAGMVCLKNMLLDDALDYFRRGQLDPRALLHLFPDHARYLGALLLPFARIAMAAGLRQLFYEIGDAGLLAEQAAAQHAGASREQALSLADALRANTLEMLERYLEHCREQMLLPEPPYPPDAIPVIDTALARLYAANARHDRLCALIRAPNSIVGDLACAYYMEAQHYYYCSLVHKAQGDIAAALGIWRRILQGEWADSRFGGLPEYLLCLEALESQETLLGEFHWLTGFDVGAALQVLARLSDATVAALDADAAIAAIQQGGDQPLRLLIERLIGAGHARASFHMTHLLKLYVRQLRDLYALDTSEARSRRNALETSYQCAQADDLGLSFRAFLRAVRNRDEGTWLRAQVHELLAATPPSFDPAEVLLCVESEAREVLAVERAMLLVRLGRALDAVDLLVECREYAEAERLLLAPDAPQSLARLAGSGPQPDPALLGELGTNAPNVGLLLRKYLALSDSDDDTSARLVSSMLSRYPSYIAVDVLDAIPAHWPCSVAAPFIRQQLQLVAHREHVSRMERSLNAARANGRQIECADLVREHGRVELDLAQTCAKCRKLLGSSAFVYDPQSRLVKHVSCT
ncbi:hypothetical protein IWW55_000217 [Coemansia sp. RSA 2706]|nr:hypothetical protein IWW55_000217 [Coemansia sp. RSA 2706]KAJ2315582.1 hypothetical protein IWW54_000175 [Coemansia sp. RSA 2705]KAJ2321292.1 hypothetical protein IWW52_000837 [Coemansia sp. RSA 2704]